MNKRIKKKQAKIKSFEKEYISLQKKQRKVEAQIKVVQAFNIEEIKPGSKSYNAIIQSKYEFWKMGKNIHLPSTEIRNQIDGDDTYVGALIKKYWDYADKGWIHHSSGLDKYELAEFIEETISATEMKNVIEQADEWRASTLEKERQWAIEREKHLHDIKF